MPDTGDERALDAAILELLRESDRELTPDEVESSLAEHTGQQVDTFSVRRAIWRLVLHKQAVLTSQRTVRASRANWPGAGATGSSG
jgi:hypothetical protein